MNEKTKIDWISIKDKLPVFRVTTYKETVMMESSRDCLCFDGETVFVDTYCSDFGFHKSITHYILIDNIKPPTI
tara:strand:+ start:831 stop:1052 length:222 start_codon:yes stop_codon:yes gene_type:complete